MTGRPSILRGLQAALASPAVAAVLAIILWIDAAAQPSTTVVGGLLTPTRRTTCFLPARIGVSRTAGGAIQVHPWDEPRSRGNVHADYRVRRTGWWAPTRSIVDTRLIFDDPWFGSTLTPLERTQVRLAYADRLEGLGLASDFLGSLRAGEGMRRNPLLSGYLHNAMAALVALGLLSFVPCRVLIATAAAGRHRRSARGLCPSCTYNRSGLPPEIPCPECGTSLYPSPCAAPSPTP